MNERILIVVMAALGFGLAAITPANVSPGLVKGLSWLIAGIGSRLFK